VETQVSSRSFSSWSSSDMAFSVSSSRVGFFFFVVVFVCCFGVIVCGFGDDCYRFFWFVFSAHGGGVCLLDLLGLLVWIGGWFDWLALMVDAILYTTREQAHRA